MTETSTEPTAGIDVAKAMLEVAVWPQGQTWSVANDPAGRRRLIGWLNGLGVKRIGLEASGGYERRAALQLREAGFLVVVLQPAQVRHFAKAMLQRAKTDRIDAAMIARFTAALDTVQTAGRPIDEELVEWFLLHEQLGEDIARAKTRRERFAGTPVLDVLDGWIATFQTWRTTCMGRIRRLIAADPPLADRVGLLASIPGIGEQTAIALAVHMPELGSMDAKQAACLLGVAPFDDSSGGRNGPRHIAGGRARPRRAIHMGVVAATRCNPPIKAFFQRLTAAGKPAKVALIACARKLIIQANAILKRNSPWTEIPEPA